MKIKQIIEGDSYEVIKKFPDSIVDIVVTSPPYNAGHDYDNYNDTLDINKYLKNMEKIFTEVYRVLKDDGKVCVNVPFAIKNMETKGVFFLATRIADVLNNIGMKDFEFITWHKGKNLNHFQGNNTAWGSWKSPSHPVFRPMGEVIMVFYKKEKSHKGNKELIDITADEFKEWTKNSWYFTEDQVYENLICIPNNSRKDEHPAPYPKELVERILKLYSYKDDLVLDPFNGIGTTTEVAAELSRNFIGIDLSNKYSNIAYKKVQKYDASLFTYDYDYANLVNSSDVKGTLNEIFPYKESFNPDITKNLKTKFGIKNANRVLDPFLGTGSTMMDPSISECVGFDTNPLAIEVSKAKLTKLKTSETENIKNYISEISKITIKSYDYPEWGPYERYASKGKYNIVKTILEYFKSNLNENEYRFVKCVILSNLDQIFDYKRDGNGIKFRHSKITENNTLEELKSILEKSIRIKEKFDEANDKRLFLKNESIIDSTIPENIDLVITSPPYANMFDYFEVYKMELWTSGIIKNKDDWNNLKKTALRSNVNTLLNDEETVNNNILNNSLENMEKHEKSIDKRTRTMILNYFYDMNKVILNIYKNLRNKAYLFIVVGNSFYNNTPLPTDEIIASEAAKIGFEIKTIIVARRLSTSPQQMKKITQKDKMFLRESIIVLYKK